MAKHRLASKPSELIEQKIYLIRGHKVMIDAGLAELYGVTTGNLNLAVRRNPKRFPEDFMFQLSLAEGRSLLLQNARAKRRGGRRTPPYAFTEQGVSMLSSVLNSERAIEVNIAIMRAFVRLHAMLATHADLARRLNELEQKYDEQFRVVFEAIRELMAPDPVPPSRRIGFSAEHKLTEEDG
ncbi:MAG: DNA-binding protein [Acidobacteria bacterium]|nr:MAG: DNA-binding protein [Acidobacteriota bacterium]